MRWLAFPRVGRGGRDADDRQTTRQVKEKSPKRNVHLVRIPLHPASRIALEPGCDSLPPPMIVRILIPIAILGLGYGSFRWLGQEVAAPAPEASEPQRL